MSTILNLSNIENGVFPVILASNLMKKKGKKQDEIDDFISKASCCDTYEELVKLIESYGITIIGIEKTNITENILGIDK